jgi:nucleotide-binding universal stress UspA family protein
MKLLLPVDGSDSSDAILRWIVQALDVSRLECYLLFVVPTFPRMIHDEYEVLDAQRLLRHARETLEAAGVRVVQAEQVPGDPVPEICRYAAEWDVDQVVMGTHGRSGLAKLIMGSVAQKVLEQCPCPVLLHKPVSAKGRPAHATDDIDPLDTQLPD